MEKYESFNPGIPIIVYDENVKLPEQGCYYVVAGNGCFFRKETTGGVIKGLVPVENIPLLKDFPVDFSIVRIVSLSDSLYRGLALYSLP